jgi:limonene-1,2-epoxide hydrolase
MLGDQFDLDSARLDMRCADIERSLRTAIEHPVQRDMAADDEGADPENAVKAGNRFIQIANIVCVLDEVLAFWCAEWKLHALPQSYIEIDASQRQPAMSRTLAMEIAPPDPAAIDIVLRFCAAWDRLDLDAIAGFLADDIFYHNIPVEPLVGKPAVETYLRSVGPFESCCWELVAIAANGPVVLTERIDRFVVKGVPIALPVSGTFEVVNGRIRKWRDYFDLASYRAQWPERQAA